MRERYTAVRDATRRLCEPLNTEDYVVQSMPDVSPAKWHLAHTTWFFETFVLLASGQEPYDPSFGYLFNSYYNAVGQQYPRERRGLLTRPTVAEIWRYRRDVDDRMTALLAEAGTESVRRVVEIGLHHEQQHQELMLTDIKHVFSQNPCSPVYSAETATPRALTPLELVAHGGGLVEVGQDADSFGFDNERPRHTTHLHPFALGSRLVTTAEYEAFIADDGYSRAELWLSEGWDWLKRESVTTPLYWRNEGKIFTLAGERDRMPEEPVTHVSYYEADAYVRWAGFRLPREHELEQAAANLDIAGNFVEGGALHPRAAEGSGMQQLFGDVWEWTQSPYVGYPGYRTPPGALGEYNGKFMCNQHVLRGGSCATSKSHIRATYRNFFPASARWQFNGIRVAADG